VLGGALLAGERGIVRVESFEARRPNKCVVRFSLFSKKWVTCVWGAFKAAASNYGTCW
jgi:hypothetical protein